MEPGNRRNLSFPYNYPCSVISILIRKYRLLIPISTTMGHHIIWVTTAKYIGDIVVDRHGEEGGGGGRSCMLNAN